MPQSFADLLRLLKPDASLLRRPGGEKPAGEARPEAVAPSLMARVRAMVPGRGAAGAGAGAEAEDVAARRLAAMARAEKARAERARAAGAVTRVASARMA